MSRIPVTPNPASLPPRTSASPCARAPPPPRARRRRQRPDPRDGHVSVSLTRRVWVATRVVSDRPIGVRRRRVLDAVRWMPNRRSATRVAPSAVTMAVTKARHRGDDVRLDRGEVAAVRRARIVPDRRSGERRSGQRRIGGMRTNIARLVRLSHGAGGAGGGDGGARLANLPRRALQLDRVGRRRILCAAATATRRNPGANARRRRTRTRTTIRGMRASPRGDRRPRWRWRWTRTATNAPATRASWTRPRCSRRCRAIGPSRSREPRPGRRLRSTRRRRHPRGGAPSDCARRGGDGSRSARAPSPNGPRRRATRERSGPMGTRAVSAGSSTRGRLARHPIARARVARALDMGRPESVDQNARRASPRNARFYAGRVQ